MIGAHGMGTAVIDAPAVRYLVVSGSADRGRSHHGVGAFATLDEAEREIALLRNRPTAAWAEVVAVDAAGRVSPLCRLDL